MTKITPAVNRTLFPSVFLFYKNKVVKLLFDFDMVIDLLRADGSIVVNKNLARNIGLDCAVLYSELASKYKYFKQKGKLTSDGYFFNTVDNLEIDTCLSSYQQRECLKKLEKYGLVQIVRRGLPAKRFFKIIPDFNVLQKYLQSQETSQLLKNCTTSVAETNELDLYKVNTNNTNRNNPNVNNNKKNKALARGAKGMFSVDNLNEEAKTVYRYFMDKYLDHCREVHPTINNETVDRLNEIFDNGYITDPEYDKDLFVDSDAMCDMIDLYFNTQFLLDSGKYADHRIYHFLCDAVLKNLYYKVIY
jgi:hypothetical protein